MPAVRDYARVCPSGLAPGASADILLRPEDLLAAWGA
jgi:hypothetical protein